MKTAGLLPSSSSLSTNLTTSSFLVSTRKLSSKTHHSHKPLSSPATLFSPTIAEASESHRVSVTKRSLTLSLILGFTNSVVCLPPVSASEDELLGLKRYTDEKEGFTLLIPCPWIKVEKAGATVLFEEVNKGINNVGVVVSPVRLNSLPEFGTPHFVVDKLIQAEKRKESTKDAAVIGVAERSGHGGLQVYEFEYSLDSTRGGMKRIFSAAFVASKKLYLLNIAYSDKPENPLDTSTKMMLEQVLHSFDTTMST